MTKNKNDRSLITQLVFGGLLAAIVTLSTMLIRIPTPTKGYINLGDCFVNISGWLLGPLYGSLAAGIGSALADLISGYAVYAAATFVIKALMAAAAFFVYKHASKHIGGFAGRITAAAAAELIMVTGYSLFEGFLYGSVSAALLGIPSNTVQAIGGAVFSVTLYETVIKRIPAVKFLEHK